MDHNGLSSSFKTEHMVVSINLVLLMILTLKAFINQTKSFMLIQMETEYLGN